MNITQIIIFLEYFNFKKTSKYKYELFISKNLKVTSKKKTSENVIKKFSTILLKKKLKKIHVKMFVFIPHQFQFLVTNYFIQKTECVLCEKILVNLSFFIYFWSE